MRPSRVSHLTAWYLALLLPTLYVKYRFMLVLARWWVEGSSTDALSDGEITSWASLWFGHVAPADVLEVALIVLALWLIGHRLLRIPIAWLATGSVAVAVLFLGLTLLSLRETGSLLTLQAVQMSWRWGLRDAGVLAVTSRQLLLAVGVALWLATPALFASLLARLERARPRLGRLLPAAAVVLVMAAAIVRPDALAFSRSISLSRGLWSSAIAMLATEAADAPDVAAGSTRDLLDRYVALVYPAGRPQADAPLVAIEAAARLPRHVLMVMLETAPREFYRLVDNDDLPTLRRMGQHALVSEHHYSAAPRTDLAVYAMLSGTYPRGGAPIYEFGRFRTDGLGTVLGAHGYTSTFVESTTVKWNVREEAVAIDDLGFGTLLEEGDAPLTSIADPFDAAVAREQRSLELARDAILSADRQGRHALVAVATNLGHFPWRAPAAHLSDAPEARVAALARAFDGLMGTLLGSLEAAALSDEVIVVVVGNHGLRFSLEFDSFGTPIRHGDLMFNVPLMVYSPALFPRTVRVPWVTSHIDIEPTLLDLLGVPRAGLLLHGENMLNRRLAERVTILPSGMFPPMYPVDGLYYRGTFSTWAYALDRVRSRPGALSAAGQSDNPLSADQVRKILGDSRRLFNETAAHFLAASRGTR